MMVGSRTLERMHKLGQGSFATVWEVREKSIVGNETVQESPIWALKVSSPINEQILEACLLEAEILQRLALLLPDEVLAANRVPQYVAHTVSGTQAAVSPTCRHGQVLVAMSKLDGKPLDQWLYGVDENRLKTITMSELLDGPLPGGQLASKNLAGACNTASALLSQMAPVFTALSGIAHHRDVSAHNFLIREEAGAEEFSLLDFGLAVRTSTWEAECRSKSICGDPRYFTPAAWTLLALGLKATQAMPDSASMFRQYEKRIDHFSFGMLVLEVLFALWKGPDQENTMDGHEKAALVTAQKAWHEFWGEAVGLFQKFHGKGLSATRQVLVQANKLSQYKDKLTALCSALRLAHDAVQSSLPALVFKIAAELIDPQGVMSWQDIKASVDDTEAAIGNSKVGANDLASTPQGSSSVPATGDEAWNWSNALESMTSWVAQRLTRNVLDLALAGAGKPKRKKRSQRRKAALC
jgi:serine/threonine protein kinase